MKLSNNKKVAITTTLIMGVLTPIAMADGFIDKDKDKDKSKEVISLNREARIFVRSNIENLTSDEIIEELKNNPDLRVQSLRLELFKRHGIEELQSFINSDIKNALFFDWLINNEEAMQLYLTSGAPSGRSSIGSTPNLYDAERWNSSLGIFKNIWVEDYDSHSDLYLKLAIATALSHSTPIQEWNTRDTINPTLRYGAYKLLHLNNLLVSDFDNYKIEELRLVVNNNLSTSDIIWSQFHMRNYDPQAIGVNKFFDSTKKVPYKTYNDDGVYIHSGNDRYYGEGWNMRDVLNVGGVCGNISTYAANTYKSFGIPSGTVAQPVHLATMNYVDRGVWQIRYDIYRWDRSGLTGSDGYAHAIVGMGFAGTINNAGKIALDKERFTESEAVRLIANQTRDGRNRELLKKAIEIDHKNIYAHQEYLDTFTGELNKADILELEEYVSSTVMTGFSEDPLMMGIWGGGAIRKMPNSETKRNISISLNNAISKYMHVDNEFEPDNINRMYLNRTSYEAIRTAERMGFGVISLRGEGTYQYQLSGMNKGELYSLDNGETFIEAKEDNPLLSEEDVMSIDERNGIVVRIKDVDIRVVVRRESRLTPSDFKFNSTENTLTTSIPRRFLQYSFDNGATWSQDIPEINEGTLIYARRAGSVHSLPSNHISFQF